MKQVEHAMNGELDKLERKLERDAEILAALSPVAPRSEAVERTKHAVHAEIARLNARQAWIGRARVWTGIAAALALAIGWTQVGGSGPVHYEAEAQLSEWAAAFDASNTQLAGVLDENWRYHELGTGDEAVELDDFLEGLDASFESLESL